MIAKEKLSSQPNAFIRALEMKYLENQNLPPVTPAIIVDPLSSDERRFSKSASSKLSLPRRCGSLKPSRQEFAVF